MPSYKIALTLIAKGSINSLHRREVVEAFRKEGIEVQFLVREDYIHLLDKLQDCQYLPCCFVEETGINKSWRVFTRYLRYLYPSWDPSKKIIFKGINQLHSKLSKRLLHRFFFFLARFRRVMRLMVALEGKLLFSKTIEGINPNNIDQLLLLGLGTYGSHYEGILNWWAHQHGISVVHLVGNYDHLSIKGYRGGPVNHLLVWGPVMRADARYFHGIHDSKIQMIGSLRHNAVQEDLRYDRKTFLRACGLDPSKKTILFAGPQGDFHYFEMLQAFESLSAEGIYQLIFRIYPDKVLMSSPSIKPIIRYAKNLPNVYVSIADPHYQIGMKDLEVPQIEQNDLWHALQHSDVVVNHFSTIGLEACMFDKPVVYLQYFPETGYTWLQPPLYLDHSLLLHNRRMLNYGVARMASNREELIEGIKDAIANPEMYKEERKLAVQQELGPLDGKALQRLVNACIEAYQTERAVNH